MIVDDEFDAIAVGVAHVRAGSRFPAATFALDRIFNDVGADVTEKRRNRLNRTVPPQADVATGGTAFRWAYVPTTRSG
jgi:hypothetical protein